MRVASGNNDLAVGERIDANANVVLLANIPEPFAFWRKEVLKLPRTFAMVHGKVIVIDPYCQKPVVMTGSQGPRASRVNDENLLLTEGDGELASQYAGQSCRCTANIAGGNPYRRRKVGQLGRASPITTSGKSVLLDRTKTETSGGCANSIFGLASWREADHAGCLHQAHGYPAR